MHTTFPYITSEASTHTCFEMLIYRLGASSMHSAIYIINYSDFVYLTKTMWLITNGKYKLFNFFPPDFLPTNQGAKTMERHKPHMHNSVILITLIIGVSM